MAEQIADTRKIATRIIRGAIAEVIKAHPTWFTEEGKAELHGTTKIGYSVSKRASGNIQAWLDKLLRRVSENIHSDESHKQSSDEKL